MEKQKNYSMESTPQIGVIPTAGKSAYQLWLDEGNVGTVIDFLESLKAPSIDINELTPEQIANIKGVEGDVGDKGDKGDKGQQGEKGGKGERGEKGERGIAGIGGSGTANLLDNSDFSTNKGWGFTNVNSGSIFQIENNEAKISLTNNDYFATPYVKLYSDETYTFSFEIKSATSYSLDKIKLFGEEQKSLGSINVTTNWNRVTIIFSVEVTGSYRIALAKESSAMISFFLRNCKIERGASYNNEWTPSLSNMKGEQGEKGDKGETGSDGTRGDNGLNGSDGTKGMDGINGVKGDHGFTWRPLLSSSGELSWYNSSIQTEPSAINIRGEKGEKGDRGATGEKGEKGDRGKGLGLNLLKNSAFDVRGQWQFIKAESIGSFTVANNIATAIIPDKSRFSTGPLSFDIPGWYTYSFEAKSEFDSFLNFNHIIEIEDELLDEYIYTMTYWARYFIHFKIEKAGTYYISIGQVGFKTVTFNFRRMKIEKGKIIDTDWSPSIYDTTNGTNESNTL